MRAIALVLGLVVYSNAWAVEPVAVWDGDFTATQTGYTLNRNGNAISQDNSTITINQSVGVKVDFSSGLSAATVMFKYSNLTVGNANRTVATCLVSGQNENRTGVYFAANTGMANGIWNTTTTYNGTSDTPATQVAIDSDKASGKMAFIYKPSDGTKLYYVGNSSATTLYYSSKLGSPSYDTAVNGYAIGGEREKANTTLFGAATGMEITAIAVFDKVLSEEEMCAYVWPSETQTISVNANTSVSALNTLIAGVGASCPKLILDVADGISINVDAAFSATIPVVIASEGSITLTAASQPDTSYFSAVDFKGVEGCVKRSWLAPGVIGINFRSTQGTDTSVALDSRGTWSHMGESKAGSSRNIWDDGVSSLNWSAATVYQKGSGNILNGWLDENGGTVNISLSGIPYESYDVIVYMSTDSQTQFQPVTVNGTAYTWNGSATVAGNSNWGGTRYDAAVYGTNALRINYLSGTLSIVSGPKNGSIRGSIAAIQVVPSECTLSLDGTATDWSTGAWKFGTKSASAPLDSANGYATINLSASTTLTIDETVAINKLVVQGSADAVLTLVTGTGASFVASESVVVKGGVLKQGSASVLGATPSIVVEYGGTFDMNGLGIDAASAVHVAGDGAGSWPWALTSSSGAGGAILGGLYLDADATIGGANELKIGVYSTSVGYRCYLQGHTMTKTGVGALTCHNMNTPGTGTIDVQGGDMSVNAYNNLNNNGGDTTVILNSGTSLANGTDRIVPMSALGLYGGTLSTASKAFKVNTTFRGAGETANLVFGSVASAMLTGDLTVTASLTLEGNVTFIKDAEATSDVVVTPTSLAASSGTITVGSGVTLNLGINRPTATITVQNGGVLAMKQQSENDIIELSVSAQPASVILYDASGNEVASPRVLFSNGKLTVMESKATLEANGTTAFDTDANWISSLKPVANGDAVIRLTGDAEITVADTYTLGSLVISGSGVATFSGAGSISAANISVQNGATFTRNANISATTGISIDSGTVLRLDGVTENAAISGAGAVETYGTVVLGHANTMTGGITVKPGSSLSASATSAYGEYSSSWAYSAQRQVVVEDGGTVDINNIANQDGGVALTIAGKGVLSGGVYSGAVTYSGANAITSGSRQISSLVLTDDAMIDLGAGWGLVHSGWGNARLGLAGHTLTVRGTGTFPVVNANNGAATTGTLVLDGATLELSNAASNLSGVNIVAKGCSSINLAKAPSALGSLTLKPSTTGTTASNWNLPSGLVPVVDSTNIDTAELTDGQVLTLFTAPEGVTLTTSTIKEMVSGRYTVTISGRTVTATFNAGLPTNFMHYDFNAANSIAADSTYNIGYLNPTFINTRNGQAGKFNSSSKPHYDSNTSGKSPFYTGELTVTSLLNIEETNNTILWNFGGAFGAGMALIAKNSTTISVVSWTGGAAGSDVVSVTEIGDLIGKWHLVTIVANANGTTLYVDDTSATVGTVLPSAIGGQGQFGSIHGSAKNYSAVSGDGYLLDDWRVYDVALTAEEVASIKKQLLPVGTIFSVY